MASLQHKYLNTPEETRTLPKMKAEVVRFGEVAIMRTTLEPGWKWSEHVGPSVGTASCQVPHLNYIISGRMRVVMDDGTEADVGPGDAVQISPGHNAWVLGDEPLVAIDFQGGHLYGK